MQTARVGGARRHAGLVPFHDQNIGAALGQIIRRAQARDAAAYHHHLSREPGFGTAVFPWRRRQVRQQRRLELGGLRHFRGRRDTGRSGQLWARRTRPDRADPDIIARWSRRRNGPGTGPSRPESPSSGPAATSGRRRFPRAIARRLFPRSGRRSSHRGSSWRPPEAAGTRARARPETPSPAGRPGRRGAIVGRGMAEVARGGQTGQPTKRALEPDGRRPKPRHRRPRRPTRGTCDPSASVSVFQVTQPDVDSDDASGPEHAPDRPRAGTRR